MNLLVLLAFLLVAENDSGYLIRGDHVEFFYAGNAQDQVYVSGNFNKWAKDEPRWRMQFDTTDSVWKLTIPKEEIKKLPGSFYEFTFRVNGTLVDAGKEQKGVIHCQGYGYRYVISGL